MSDQGLGAFNGGNMTGGGIFTDSGTVSIGASFPTLVDGVTFEVAGVANYNANNTNFTSLPTGVTFSWMEVRSGSSTS